MVTSGTDLLPKLLGALIILAVGWIVAKIIQKVISVVGGKLGIDKLAGDARLGAGTAQSECCRLPFPVNRNGDRATTRDCTGRRLELPPGGARVPRVH